MTKVQLLDRTGKTADPAVEDELDAFYALQRELIRRGAPVPVADDAAVFAAIARMPAKKLRLMCWAARGRQSCMHIRTGWSKMAEAEDGFRARGRGRDKVVA